MKTNSETSLFAAAAWLSDVDLIRQVDRLAAQQRQATAELVAHLAELDARKLHLARGYGSLFSYCTQALRLSEHAAYNRIVAARACRIFPAVLDLLADGSLNLSTLRLLAPHLKAENAESLLSAANGRGKREVEELVARIAPRPDVASSIRKLPSRPLVQRSATAEDGVLGTTLIVQEASSQATLKRTAMPNPESAAPTVPAPRVPALSTHQQAGRVPALLVAATHPADGSRTRREQAAVVPLAPERYRIQFTVDRKTHDKLRRAQDLLRRELRDGDVAAIFDRALTLLLEDVARSKLAATPRPRPAQARSVRSRHVPASVKRAVWLRDDARCAFVAEGGRRCSQRAFLELHHVEPHGVGGETSAANLSLRCRAHNAYEAELIFGNRAGSRDARAQGAAALPFGSYAGPSGA